MDQESDEVFVLMDADAYEAMLPMAAPTPKHSDDEGLEDYVLDDILDMEEAREETPVSPVSVPSRFTAVKEQPAVPKTVKPSEPPEKKKNLAENWEKETNSPIISEENLSDVPHDGEEEEKFYLEPVE